VCNPFIPVGGGPMGRGSVEDFRKADAAIRAGQVFGRRSPKTLIRRGRAKTPSKLGTARGVDAGQ